MNSSVAFHGYRIGTPNRAVKHFAAGRICKEPGCRTTLSIYNPLDLCSVHKRPGRPPRNRATRLPEHGVQGGVLR
jgi:hypothetical protein